MHSHNALAPLVTAALLARSNGLSVSERSSVIACTPTVRVPAPEAAWDHIACAFREARVPCPWKRRPSHESLHNAVIEGERWAELGVFLISPEMIQPQNAAVHSIPRVLFALGNRSVLREPAAAILNSRKPLQISPTDSWLHATKTLVSRAREEGMAIVSSYGSIAYDMTSWLAKGSSLLVVGDEPIPFMEPREKCVAFLNRNEGLFDLKSTLFISAFPPGPLPSRSSRLPLRDRLVAALASVVMAADVRPKGNMAEILDLATRRGIPVMRSEDACGSEPRLFTAEQSPSSQDEQEGRTSVQAFHDLSCCLFHYARSCPGPWPGQTIADYCRSLAEGSPGSRHTAFDALEHILEEGMIRGSSRLTRGSLPMVSFTECRPEDLHRIIRWRPGLVRWSFECYGIAIPRKLLQQFGARPVVYGQESAASALPQDDRPFFQVRKTASTEWSNEREWRLRGDLDLRLVPPERLTVVVPTVHEARTIGARFGYTTVVLDSGGPKRSDCP